MGGGEEWMGRREGWKGVVGWEEDGENLTPTLAHCPTHLTSVFHLQSDKQIVEITSNGQDKPSNEGQRSQRTSSTY